MPWLPSSSARLAASSSKALSSSKEPWTNRTLLASRSQTSSHHAVRACSRAAERASSENSTSPQSRRAKPSSAKLVGSSPRLARSYTAGSSFLRARSPVMPKTTRAQGSGTRGSRRSRGSRSGLVIKNVRPSWAQGKVAPLQGPTTSVRVVGGRGVLRLLLLLLELALDRVGELVPGVDELLHALVLENLEDVLQVDPGVGDRLQHAGRVLVGLLHRGPGLAVVGVGLHRLLRHRVHDARGDQLGDVERVGVVGVLHAGRRPERPLDGGA